MLEILINERFSLLKVSMPLIFFQLLHSFTNRLLFEPRVIYFIFSLKTTTGVHVYKYSDNRYIKNEVFLRDCLHILNVIFQKQIFFLEFIWASDDCNLSLETGTLWINYYKKWRFWSFEGYEKYALL